MRALAFLVAVLLAAPLAGCMRVDVYDPSITVTAAEMTDGACDTAPVNNTTTSTSCHVLAVRVFNPGRASALPLHADRWSAETDAGQNVSLPQAEGPIEVARGEVETVTLRFNATAELRLVRVHYRDALYGVDVAAAVPDYGP